MLDATQHAALRARFPILNQKTYLYNCSQGALSDAAEGGARAYLESWRSSAAPWDEWVGAYEAIRAQFASFINASPDEVAVLTSASAGINAIASAIDFSRRPKVVMGEYEFPTMGHIWLAQQARGARIEFLPGVDQRIPVESYERAVDEQTAIVPLTQVSFANGARSDIAAVGRIAHERGALLFVDGYQDCGTRPIDVKAMDADIYVTGTLKYLLGPPGLAFLYVKRELIESLHSTITSWMAQREVFAFNAKHYEPAGEARRFEGGSPPMPSIYAAAPALVLLTSVGMEHVADHIQALARAFLSGARKMGIAAKTPDDTVGPLVVLRSHDAGALAAKLIARNVLVSSRLDGVRFSFHVYNNQADVDAALAALSDNLGLLVRE